MKGDENGKKNGTPERKKLVIRKDALQKLTLEDEDLEKVVGGGNPPPIFPGMPIEW